MLVTHTSCMQDMPATMLNYGLTEQFRKCMGSTGFQGLIFFHCVPLAETLKQNSEPFFHSQYFTNLIHIFLDYAYTLL